MDDTILKDGGEHWYSFPITSPGFQHLIVSCGALGFFKVFELPQVVNSTES